MGAGATDRRHGWVLAAVQWLGAAVSMALLVLWAVSWLHGGNGIQTCTGTRRPWLVWLASGDLDVATGPRDQFCKPDSYAPGGDLDTSYLYRLLASFHMGGPLWWAFCATAVPTTLILVRRRRARDAVPVVRSRIGRLVARLKWSTTGTLLVGVACWTSMLHSPKELDFNLDDVYTLSVLATSTHLEIDGWSPQYWASIRPVSVTAPVGFFTGPPTRYVPLWPIGLTLFLLLAVLWWLDRPRVPPGYCRKCRYDLTGNVSGRCPECGTEVAGNLRFEL